MWQRACILRGNSLRIREGKLLWVKAISPQPLSGANVVYRAVHHEKLLGYETHLINNGEPIGIVGIQFIELLPEFAEHVEPQAWEEWRNQ